MGHRARWWAALGWIVVAALPGLAQTATARIAFQRSGVGGAISTIVVMAADGSQPVELRQTGAAQARITPALSPDGSTVAFGAKVGERYKLFTWKLDDQNAPIGQPVQVTANTDTTDKFPAWSPDGRRIAYLAVDQANKTSLRVIGADGTDMKEIASNVGYHATPCWRPDGQALLYIDLVDKKPVLKNILATGGYAIAIREQSRIIAACYSPDGTRVAALIRSQGDLCDLWIIPPFGVGGKQLVEGISGANGVSWPDPQTLVFNAAKVGARAGKAFWKVDPATGELQGITGYAEPKLVSYFSVAQGAGGGTAAPGAEEPAPPRQPTGPVTIATPAAGSTVRGVVPVRILAQRDVATVVVRIQDQFLYAAEPTRAEQSAPYVLYRWNTQELAQLDPTRGGIPSRYDQVLRYPDGEYTLAVIGLNRDNEPLGKQSVKVTVQNGITTPLPANLILKFQYRENLNSEENYLVRGDGTLFGAGPGAAVNLQSSLDIRVRRTLVEARSNGSADLRTYLQEASPDIKYPLSFGLKESTLPEGDESGLYTVTPNGDLYIVPQLSERVYVPLSQIVVSLPLTPAQVGTQWPGKLWLVADLLEREATTVRADSRVDGVEWIGDRPAVRIRSDYRMESQIPNLSLAVEPIAARPSLRSTSVTPSPTTPGRAAPGAVGMPPGAVGMPPGMGVTAPGVTSVAQRIKVQQAVGVRYSWFDYERNRLLRVEDVIVYSFPTANLPGAEAPYGPGMTPGGPPGVRPPSFAAPRPPTGVGVPTGAGTGPFGRQPASAGGVTGLPPTGTSKPGIGTAWYLVRYTYRYQSPAETESAK